MDPFQPITKKRHCEISKQTPFSLFPQHKKNRLQKSRSAVSSLETTLSNVRNSASPRDNTTCQFLGSIFSHCNKVKIFRHFPSFPPLFGCAASPRLRIAGRGGRADHRPAPTVAHSVVGVGAERAAQDVHVGAPPRRMVRPCDYCPPEVAP